MLCSVVSTYKQVLVVSLGSTISLQEGRPDSGDSDSASRTTLRSLCKRGSYKVVNRPGIAGECFC